MNKKNIMLVGLVIISGSAGWFLHDLHNQYQPEDVAARRIGQLNKSELPALINASDFVSVRPAVTSLPTQTLSDEERNGLIFMREEEKLARDVYSSLFDTWDLPIFSNIAQSEQTHTEAVRNLLEKYDITDPVTDDSVGVFKNTDLQSLYTELTTRGNTSIEEALAVGTLIEDLDIRDIQREITKTDNADIALVYENLLRGSRNHLRSFVSQLTARGVVYNPQYISVSEFDEIISTATERGSRNQSNGGRGWGRQR